MNSLFNKLLKPFGSIGLSCILLIFLSLLTWLGTLEQVNMGLFDVQKKYFESLFLVHWAGPIPIPLPGAYLVMCLLFANLFVGGVVRLRRKQANMGILITHFGILFLLIAGFITLFFSQNGHVTLYEGEESDFYQSYYRSEIVMHQDLGDEGVRQITVPEEQFLRGENATLRGDVLPFDLVVDVAMRNARPRQKGPMFTVDVPVVDGAFLQQLPLEENAESNRAALYVSLINKADGTTQQGILSTRSRAPWVVDVDGERWALDLRKERYRLPFSIKLEDFTKDDHPNMGMARSFFSDVTVTEEGAARQQTISMNEPLRDEGLVIYQTSWGPAGARPGDRLFSTMEVVRNPADQYPLYACIIIAVGLVLHFSNRLTRYVRAEGKAA